MQAEHEAQVARQPGEERDLGRPRVREDRRQVEPAQHVDRRVADRCGGSPGEPTAKCLAFSRGDRGIPYHGAMASSHEPRPEYHRSTVGASEEIAALIRRWLEEQRLQPGERIGTEQEMADEFGVSRPTLREALRLLSASHLIRVGRGRTGGIFVASTPSEGMSRNVSESIALMLAAAEHLDGGAARRAAVARGADRRPRGGQRGRRRRATASRRRSRPRSATSPGPRRSTPRTAASTRSSPRPRATTCCARSPRWILEVLQPTLVAHISVERRRGRDPCPAPRDPARGAAAPALRGGACHAGAHRVPDRRAERAGQAAGAGLGVGERQRQLRWVRKRASAGRGEGPFRSGRPG